MKMAAWGIVSKHGYSSVDANSMLELSSEKGMVCFESARQLSVLLFTEVLVGLRS
jgi:hypothetical protein